MSEDKQEPNNPGIPDSSDEQKARRRKATWLLALAASACAQLDADVPPVTSEEEEPGHE